MNASNPDGRSSSWVRRYTSSSSRQLCHRKEGGGGVSEDGRREWCCITTRALAYSPASISSSTYMRMDASMSSRELNSVCRRSVSSFWDFSSRASASLNAGSVARLESPPPRYLSTAGGKSSSSRSASAARCAMRASSTSARRSRSISNRRRIRCCMTSSVCAAASTSLRNAAAADRSGAVSKIFKASSGRRASKRSRATMAARARADDSDAGFKRGVRQAGVAASTGESAGRANRPSARARIPSTIPWTGSAALIATAIAAIESNDSRSPGSSARDNPT